MAGRACPGWLGALAGPAKPAALQTRCCHGGDDVQELAESSQIPLAEAAADLSSLAERGICAGRATLAKVLQSGRNEQILPFCAVFLGVVE